MKKVIFVSLALLLAAAIAGGTFYFNRLRQDSAKASQSVLQTAVVEKGNIIATISTNGNVVLPDQQNLSFGVSGTIKEIKVDNGYTVKKGEVVAILDTISLERAVAQAQANLQAAEISLKKTQNPYKDTDIITAEAAVFSAESSLKAAQKSMDDYMTLYTDTDLRLAEADVRNARLNLESALQDKKLNLRIQGNTVGKSYEQELQSAQTARERARIAYRDIVWRIYKAESLIPDTEYHLHLNPMKMGFIAEEAFDKNVEDAYWTWINADISYQKLVLEKKKNEDTLENNVNKAKDAISKAEQNLANIKEWPKDSEIEARKNQIESAQLAIQKAKANLADIKAGADPLDIELRKNQILQSRISLDTAKDNLDKAILVAPFDGTIFNMTAKLGQEVSGSTTVMQIVNTRRVRIDAFIDEVDIARVREGQESQLTFDALPGLTMPGRVSTVSYIATRQSGVTSFATNIELDLSGRAPQGSASQPGRAGAQTPAKPGQVPRTATAAKTGGSSSTTGGSGNLSKTGQPGQGNITPGQSGGSVSTQGEQRARPVLRDGMTAIVTILTEKREGVLTVPNRAIVTQGRNRIVKVKVGDKIEERTVRAGLTDGSRTEIVSGVEEGELVIVPTPQVRTTPAKVGGSVLPGKMGF